MHPILVGLFILFFQEPTESEVNAAVEAFVQSEAGSPERNKAEIRLEKIRPGRLSKAVGAILMGKDSAKWAKALQLADAYRVPGLLEKVKKYFDGDTEATALRVAMIDPAGGAIVFDRWAKSDASSPGFAPAEGALASRDILDLATLSKLAAALSGEKAKSAAAILAYQFNLQVKDPGSISASWTGLKAGFVRDSKAFPSQGTDLLALGLVQNSRRAGSNLRLLSGGKLTIPLPDRVQSGNHTIKMHLLPLGPRVVADYQKMVGGQRASWPLQLDNGKWLVRTGDGKEFSTDARPGEWTEVVFEVVDLSRTDKGVQQNIRDLTILVDGKAVLPKGQHTGLLTDIVISAEEGSMVVGNIDLIFPGKAR